MKYFGDYLNQFFKEADLIKGSQFDHNKCHFHMASDESLQTRLIDKMIEGDGEYFKWQGELISTAGGSIVSDNPNSQLKQFYAVDLDKTAKDVQAKFNKSIRCYEIANQANNDAPYGVLMHRFYFNEYSETCFHQAAAELIGELNRAFSHALVNKDAMVLDSDDFQKIAFRSGQSIADRQKWGELDWVKDNVCFQEHIKKVIQEVNVDTFNDSFYSAQASQITYDFCKKRDFKAFSRFKFSTISLWSYNDSVQDFDSQNYFEKSKSALVQAFTAQSIPAMAYEIGQLNYHELVNMELGQAKKLHSGTEIIRRKESFEIKLPKELVSQLQIFLLKYDRKGVERYVA